MRIFRYLLTFTLSFSFVFVAGCSDSKPDYSEFYKPQPGDEPEEPVNPGLDDNQLKVMSFNIRYSSGDDGANSWDNRKQAVPAMFADQQPTVLGVQEARLDQKTYMDENCAGYKSIGVGRTDGQNAGEFMAIYYLDDAVKLEKWGTFWLSDTPDTPSIGWDASTYRTATWAVFTHYKSGRKFFYVNTHIDHVGQVAAQKSMELIEAKIRSLNPDNLPTLLTADFNKMLDSPIRREEVHARRAHDRSRDRQQGVVQQLRRRDQLSAHRPYLQFGLYAPALHYRRPALREGTLYFGSLSHCGRVGVQVILQPKLKTD